MTSSLVVCLDLLLLYSSSKDKSAMSAMGPDNGTALSNLGNSGLTCAGKSVAWEVWYTSAIASAASATGTTATFARSDAAATPLTSFCRSSGLAKKSDCSSALPSPELARATTLEAFLACLALCFPVRVSCFTAPLANTEEEVARELIAFVALQRFDNNKLRCTIGLLRDNEDSRFSCPHDCT